VTYNHSRAEDFERVLGEISEIARKERPDLICHTGDLFDSSRPAYADMERAVRSLRELADLAPVVVLAGNHDSPALFRLFNDLLASKSAKAAVRIRFIERPKRPDEGGLLRFESARGEPVRLAVLPFVHANRLVDVFEGTESWMVDYADRVRDMQRILSHSLEAGFDAGRDVLLFAAHLHVGGAVRSGSERQLHITDTYATRAESLPPVSYAAFGHIHKPQDIPGEIRARYAGSPIQLDFGEVGEQKFVVVVDARPGRPAVVTPVPLSGGRPLRKLEGTLKELRRIAPSVGPELCLVTVHTDAPTPMLSEQVRALLPKATVLQVTEVCAAHRVKVMSKEDVPNAEPSFEALFRDYLAEEGTRGASADRVMKTFSTLIQAVEEERLPSFPEEALLAAPGAQVSR